LGTRRHIDAALYPVEVITTDAVKSDPTPFCIIISPVPTIIIYPQRGKPTQHQQAVQDDIIGDTWRHGAAEIRFTQRSPAAKGK
jgi:hypothetical protein